MLTRVAAALGKLLYGRANQLTARKLGVDAWKTHAVRCTTHKSVTVVLGKSCSVLFTEHR